MKELEKKREVVSRRIAIVGYAEEIFPGFMKNNGYEIVTPLFSDVALEAQVSWAIERTRSPYAGAEFVD